jgi:DNA modification methylase
MTVRILTGDVRERLAEIPDASVQCCVTSPPYFGLRDYGTAAWAGGSDDCDHRKPSSAAGSTLQGGKKTTGHQQEGFGATCGKCGAVRQDRQIGLEPTLAEYVQTLVEVFREVRRVLRDDGVLWLNLGDSYAGGGGYAPDAPSNQNGSKQSSNAGSVAGSRASHGLKPKDLMMVPARVALALQDDGWYLRSDVIWHKPNPMPESVTDRPTSAHEHIFLLTKRSRYYYDADAIREKSEHPNLAGKPQQVGYGDAERTFRQDIGHVVIRTDGRNCRNVWTMATAPYKEAHFATFPPELPRRCILAGTSEKGACAACGAPWVRCVNLGGMVSSGPNGLAVKPRSSNRQDFAAPLAERPKDGYGDLPRRERTTTGWRAGCECDAGTVPCVVLDPFAGAGTALLVADRLGRDAIGVELNPDYAALIERRLKEDAPMFVELERTDVRPAQAAMLL